MKWKVSKLAVVETLQNLISIVEKAALTPITLNVKLTVRNGQMTLVTTDTRLQIKAVLQVSSESQEQHCVTTVSAQKLLDSCSSCKDETVNFDYVDDKLRISFSDGRFNLLTLPAVDFPELQQTDFSSHVTLPQKIWKELIRSTLFAVQDRQQPREALKGLLLEVKEDKLRLLGTDGHRLCIAQTTLIDSVLSGEAFREVILPKKSVIEMLRLFTDSEDMLTLSFSGRSHVSFKLVHNNITFTSNLIEADFPNVNDFIPFENEVTLVTDRQELIEKIGSVVVIQKEKPRTVLLVLEENHINICCSNFEGEDAELSMPADYSGENMQMAFNEQYFKESLATLTNTEVTMKLSDAKGSVFIRENGDVERLFVIMPLRM